MNKNYRFSLSTFKSNFFIGRNGVDDISLKSMISSLKIIFSVTDDVIMLVLDKWIDFQGILINNRIVEIQEKLYGLGIVIELSEDEKDTLLRNDGYYF